MSYRRLIVSVLALMVVAAACSQDPPPPPQPTGPTAEELEQMRQDSIRAAEEARRRAEEEARMRAEAEAAAARNAAIAAARAKLAETIYFDYDESTIRTDAEMRLREKVEILRANPSLTVRIEGHADERGSTEYNLALGTRRAETVRSFFTSFGLDASRFSITSHGEERRAHMGQEEEHHQLNRRAEFIITGGTIDPGM